MCVLPRDEREGVAARACAVRSLCLLLHCPNAGPPRRPSGPSPDAVTPPPGPARPGGPGARADAGTVRGGDAGAPAAAAPRRPPPGVRPRLPVPRPRPEPLPRAPDPSSDPTGLRHGGAPSAEPSWPLLVSGSVCGRQVRVLGPRPDPAAPLPSGGRQGGARGARLEGCPAVSWDGVHRRRRRPLTIAPTLCVFIFSVFYLFVYSYIIITVHLRHTVA